jgi:hypothetical protein
MTHGNGSRAKGGSKQLEAGSAVLERHCISPW